MSSAFTPWSASSSSGLGFPFSFVRERSSSTFGIERAPALVGGEQGVEVLGRALARERGAPAVGIAASGLEVDHERSLEVLDEALWLRATRQALASVQLPAVCETYAATSAIC